MPEFQGQDLNQVMAQVCQGFQDGGFNINGCAQVFENGPDTVTLRVRLNAYPVEAANNITTPNPGLCFWISDSRSMALSVSYHGRQCPDQLDDRRTERDKDDRGENK